MDNKSDDAILDKLNSELISEFGAAIGYTTVVMVMGIVGNITSVVYYGFKSRKSTTNYLITSLAVTDLFACVVFSVSLVKVVLVNFTDRILCKLISFSVHWLITQSLCMFVVICVDRYRKICQPHRWQLSICKTKLSVAGVVAIACITSIKDLAVLDIVPVILTDYTTGRDVTAHFCIRTKDHDLQTLVKMSHLLDAMIFRAIFVSVCAMYMIIIRTLWRFQRNKDSSRTRDIARTVINCDSGAQALVADPSTDTNETENVQEDTHTCSVTIQSVKNISGATHEIDENMKEAIVADRTSVSQQDENAPEESNKAELDSTGATCYAENQQKENGTFSGTPTDQNARTNINMNTANETSCIRKSERNAQYGKGRVERNVTVMFIVMTAASILSFVPYFIVVLTVSELETYRKIGIQLAVRSFFLNNALNPYIYVIFNPTFRSFIRKGFQKCLRNCVHCLTLTCCRK